MARRRSCWPTLYRILRGRAVRLLLFVAAFVLVNMALFNVTLMLTSTGAIRIVQAAIEIKTKSGTAPSALCHALTMPTANMDAMEANATYERAYRHMRDTKQLVVPAERYLTATCDEIHAGLGVPYSYVTSNAGSNEFDSPEDFEYQIAYSINTFKLPFQVERLLRAIYRPQHIYCIHVDPKADAFMTAVMAKLSVCFPNVIFPSRRVDVYWGTFSVLDADLVCMQALYERSKSWKYYINLTGQEFPLKTNAELVRILKALNGSNAMEATRKRVPDVVWRQYSFSDMRKLGVEPTKGAVSVVVTRQFVDFALHNEVASRVLDIIRQNVTFPSPSELFFSTLNFNPHIGTPGAYLGEPETSEVHPYFNRLKDWGAPPFNFSCKSSLRVRLICIWGMKDLPLLTDSSRPELFVNKLYFDYEPLALDCLESWFWNRAQLDIERGSEFDTSYYSRLDSVRNHVPVSAVVAVNVKDTTFSVR